MIFFSARYQESIRELESLQNNQDFKLASLFALVSAHQATKSSGRFN